MNDMRRVEEILYQEHCDMQFYGRILPDPILSFDEKCTIVNEYQRKRQEEQIKWQTNCRNFMMR